MASGDKGSRTNHRLLKLLVGMAGIASWIAYRQLPEDQRARMTHMFTERLHRAHQSLVDYLIPHERNGYQPRVFQARAVKHILLLVVVVKVALISTLFIFYPNLGSLQSDIRSQMYALINEYRTEKNVPTLSINVDLELAAQNKGADMLAQNYFSHYGPDGKKPWQWLDPATYDFKAMGENLAMDFLTSNSVFKAFKASPTHDKNLVNPAYQEVGIAVKSGQLNGHETNIMVVFFGTRKDASIRVADVGTQPATLQPSVEPVQAQPQPSVQPKPTPQAPVQPAPQAPVQQPTQTVAVQADPTPASTVVNTNTAPEQQDPSAGPNVGIRKVAEAQPQIEVLGEAIANEQGQVVEHFTAGVTLSKGSWLQRLIGWSDRFLMVFLLALVLLFAVNLVVKIRVQHAHIIANALMLIIVVAGALYLQVHAVEAMGEQIKILGATLGY